MLNLERVREMTKLAIFDKNEGEACRPMTQYFRWDYIASEMQKSFIFGTAVFLIVLSLFGIYNIERLMAALHGINFRAEIAKILLWYTISMAVYLGITYAVSDARYKNGRSRIRQYYKHLKKVNQLYREEEQA